MVNMGTSSNTNNNSPRKSFGGNNHSAIIPPRAWWHWGVVVLVLIGIIGFVVLLMFSDPAQVSLEQLRVFILYALILFALSISLGVLELLRLRKRKK